MVFVSKGSDINISYSLNANRYPLVLKKVNTKANKETVAAQSTGIQLVNPKTPYPTQAAMVYPMIIR